MNDPDIQQSEEVQGIIDRMPIPYVLPPVAKSSSTTGSKFIASIKLVRIKLLQSS